MTAAMRLPPKPISPATASASSWSGALGLISRLMASNPATHALHEDGEHDGETGVVLSSTRSEGERDADRYGRQSISEVVDQVGQQRDAVG